MARHYGSVDEQVVELHGSAHSDSENPGAYPLGRTGLANDDAEAKRRRSAVGFRVSAVVLSVTAMALFSGAVRQGAGGPSTATLDSSVAAAALDHPHPRTEDKFANEESENKDDDFFSRDGEDGEGTSFAADDDGDDIFELDGTESSGSTTVTKSCGKGCTETITVDDDVPEKADTGSESSKVVVPEAVPEAMNQPAASASEETIVYGDDTVASSVINVTNKYTANSTASYPLGSKYPWMSSYLSIVEPYREATFTLNDLASFSAPYPHFDWRIDGTNYTGSVVKHTFEHVNRAYSIEVWINDNTGAVLIHESHDVFCKYVRRELRDMHDSDRERFLSAMAVIYTTDTETGRSKYGDQYKSAMDFVRIHNSLSGRLDCDHLHGGLGFLPQHAAMTYALELSLQSVDPSVTMPYWDYTIEQSRMDSDDDLSSWYENSEVFADDWFGPMGLPGDEYVVAGEGRFAYLDVPKDAWQDVDPATGLSTVTNPWGLMRSPWNTNKSPYLSRSRTSYGYMLDPELVPGCSSHYDIMKEEIWSEFGYSIQEAPHGSLHILIGGTWGADYASFMEEINYSSRRAQPMATITLARIWRKGWLTCPSYCSMDTDPADCKCTCPELDRWEDENKGKVMLKNMYPGLASAPDFLEDDNGTDVTNTLMELFCNTDSSMNPQVGDFMQSSSPLDPLFWPTHPTLDRLWQWRKINSFQDGEWDDQNCTGHNFDDTTVWHNLFNEEEGDSDLYTVGDLMTYFDPTAVEVPYIYEHFEWTHCAEMGYPLDLLPEDVVPGDDDGAGWGKGTEELDDEINSASPIIATPYSGGGLEEEQQSAHVAGSDERTDSQGDSDTKPEGTKGSSELNPGWQQTDHGGAATATGRLIME